MELVLGGGLAALGNYISKEKPKKKRKNIKLPKHHKTHVNNIYDSNIVKKNKKIEQKRVNKIQKLSENTEETGVVPRFYNQKNNNENKHTYLYEKSNDLKDNRLFENFNQSNGIGESYEDQFKLNTFSNNNDHVAKNVSNLNDKDIEIMSLERNLALNGGWSAFNSENDDMTYKILDKDKLYHNNMVPFFKGQGLQHNEGNFNNRNLRMELFSGSSNLNHYHPKKEVEPFFEPTKDLTYVNGVPNQTNILETRFIPGKELKKIIPFVQEKVGPGLNLGYHEESKHGRHDTFRAMPKNVDDLRPITRKKEIYEGRVVDGQKGSRRGLQAPVVKRLPDTFKIYNTKDLVRTGGVIKGQKSRGNYIAKETKKEKLQTEHFGFNHASDIKPSYRIKKTTQKSKRNNFKSSKPTNLQGKSKHNQNIKSYNILDNERRSTQFNEYEGNIKNVSKSKSFNPKDVPSKTIKELTLNNNHSGNIGNRIKKSSKYNPNDTAKKTLKELIIDNNHAGNIGNQIKKSKKYDPSDTTRITTKETTVNNIYNTNIGNQINKSNKYDPSDTARITTKETTVENMYNTNIGNQINKSVKFDPTEIARMTTKETTVENMYNTNIGNQINKSVKYDPNDTTKTTLRQTTMYNERDGNIGNMINKSIKYDPTDTTKTTLRQTTMYNERDGNIGNMINKTIKYDPNDTSRTTLRQTTMYNERDGNIGNMINKSIKYDPTDTTRTTLRQTTMYNERDGNIGNMINKSIKYDPNDTSRTTLRQTTMYNKRDGNIGNMINKSIKYDPNDKTKTTLRETMSHNEREGNVSNLVNKSIKYDPTDITRTTLRETMSHNEREGNVSNLVNKSIKYDPTDITRTTLRETMSHNKREGNVNNLVNKSIKYDPNDKARTTLREMFTHTKHIAPLKGLEKKPIAYNPKDIPAPTLKEMLVKQYNIGIISGSIKKGTVFNPTDIPAPTLKEMLINATRAGGLSGSKMGGYLSNKYDAKVTLKQLYNSIFYTFAPRGRDKHIIYDAELNMYIDNRKDMIERKHSKRNPTNRKYDEIPNKNLVNIQEIKQKHYLRNNMITRNNMKGSTQTDIAKITNNRQINNQPNRINSDILNNLVSNPLVNNLVIKNNSNNNVMNEIGKITGNIYNGDIETFLDDGVVHPPDNPFTISDMPCNNPDIPDIM
jgi:hypothetical protein